MPQTPQIETTNSEELTVLIHESPPGELGVLLDQVGIEERHIQLMLRRSDLGGDLIERIGGNRKWAGSEAVRLGIVTHPHAPRRLAMTLLRQLFAFNLVRASLNPRAPAEVRCVAEELLIERIRQLPLSEKLLLARRGPARVAGALLAEGHSDVLPAVLQSPFLTEAQVVRVLWRASVPPHVVITLADHPKWSSHYLVRVALLRNQHTPIAAAMRFLPNVLSTDLRELLRGGNVPGHLREQVRREVARRSGGGSGNRCH